ncbi:MAG: hypothetical protein ACQEQB_13630 [Bacteroidota bacterium]
MRSIYNLIVVLAAISFMILKANAETNGLRRLKGQEKSYLTFNLFSSLNTFTPRWRIGYVRGISPKWKIGSNFGYGNNNLSYTQFANHFDSNYSLWEIRPEIYRIFRQNEVAEHYYSIELFYINHKDVFQPGYFYPKTGGVYFYDQANYQRHKYGFNIKRGILKKFRNNFGINIYTGLGLRIRDNSFTNVINAKPTITYKDMFDFEEYKKIDGLKIGLNFALGLKLIF